MVDTPNLALVEASLQLPSDDYVEEYLQMVAHVLAQIIQDWHALHLAEGESPRHSGLSVGARR